jgi:predicted O-linked N-acetylglucosamine transferase (SPINDLY family)
MPVSVQTMLSQASVHLQAGRRDQALTLARRVLRQTPANVPAIQVLLAALGPGEMGQGAAALERAVAASPRDAGLRFWLASVDVGMGRLDEAAVHARQAVELKPDFGEAHAALAELLIKTDLDGAIRSGEAAVRLHPGRIEPVAALVGALLHAGRAGRVVEVLREARSRLGENTLIQRMLVGAMNYLELPPEEVFAEHRRLGEVLAREFPAESFGFRRERRGALRVGYVSPDLRNRSVGHFVEPIIVARDRGRVHVTCYSTSAESDDLTRRLRDASDGWVDASVMDDRALTDKIRADGIDVLVDLAGHTGGSRVAPLCWRAAPVQVTYIGYPNTTGIATMDYRIVDSHTDPVGAERLCTEKLVRLDPCFLCYKPPEHTPAVAARPVGAPVTFGSFNSHVKLNQRTFVAWAEVLKGVPGSRLFLKSRGMASGQTQEETRRAFAALGVGPERLELRGETSGQREHLEAYGEVDVALDTFPYHGTTTTLEALLMGVPVVTLAGATHASRVGVSLLTNVGHPELVAGSWEEYVRVAVALGCDVQRRAALRESLRPELLASAICDSGAFSERLAGAYTRMWDDWAGSSR